MFLFLFFLFLSESHVYDVGSVLIVENLFLPAHDQRLSENTLVNLKMDCNFRNLNS